jgi:ABC-type nickel/cobalt efflux system permease component RcnA
VNTNELIFAIMMVVLLLGLGGYMGWRQWRTLRRLPHLDIPGDDRKYQQTLAWRRLISAGLLIILAGLMVSSYWLGQERRAHEMSQQRQAEDTPPSAEQKQFLTQYSTFWIVFGLVLLGLVGLAFMDIWTIHRFARRSLRQIQADRRAMIEHEVAEYRRQRNGF